MCSVFFFYSWLLGKKNIKRVCFDCRNVPFFLSEPGQVRINRWFTWILRSDAHADVLFVNSSFLKAEYCLHVLIFVLLNVDFFYHPVLSVLSGVAS